MPISLDGLDGSQQLAVGGALRSILLRGTVDLQLLSRSRFSPARILPCGVNEAIA